MLLQCSSGCSAPDVAIEKIHTFCRFPTDITQCCVDVLCVAWTGHHPVCCVDVAPCCFSDLCVAMSNFAQSDNVKELEGWEMAGTDDAWFKKTLDSGKKMVSSATKTVKSVGDTISKTADSAIKTASVASGSCTATEDTCKKGFKCCTTAGKSYCSPSALGCPE